MSIEKNLNWQKIIWASVVIFGLVLLAYIKYQKSQDEIGFDFYPYVIWPYIIGMSIMIILLRLSRVIRNTAFVYILIGLLNATIGVVGIYLDLTSQVKMS